MMRYILYYVLAMAISVAALPQMREDVSAELKETNQQQAKQLLLNIPCRPCHLTDDTGQCRKIYGCSDDADNETTSTADVYDVEYAKDYEVSNNTDSEPMVKALNKPIPESLCLPCFQVDRFFRCRKIRGCVIATTKTPIDGNMQGTSFTASEKYANRGDSVAASAAVDERTQVPGSSNHETVTSKGTAFTENTRNFTSPSPAPTNFIKDIPLLKTFSPSVVTMPSGATEITNDTTREANSTTKSPSENTYNSSQDNAVNATPPISTAKPAVVSITTNILLKTPTSLLSTLSTSGKTLSGEHNNGTVVTTKETTTTTPDSCRNQNGNFGVNIWCYFKNLWNWKR